MVPKLFVFDDFYIDPDEVRNVALSQVQWEEDPNAGTYPGLNSLDWLAEDYHDDFFMQVTGSYVHRHLTYGQFRKSYVNSTFKQDIHFDPGPDWIAIVYLTQGQSDKKGTTFYRHSETGLREAPLSKYDYPKYGFRDFRLAHNQLCEDEGLDHSVWEIDTVIPFIYNRMIMFRPNMFHNHGDLFGRDDHTARLVQIFMWKSEHPDYEWWRTLDGE